MKRLVELSGISGRSNPLAAPVQWVMGDDGITRGWATYSAAYEGPAGSLHERIEYAAGVERVEGRKIWVWGTAECRGVRLAEAEILFVAPREGRPREGRTRLNEGRSAGSRPTAG